CRLSNIVHTMTTRFSRPQHNGNACATSPATCRTCGCPFIPKSFWSPRAKRGTSISLKMATANSSRISDDQTVHGLRCGRYVVDDDLKSVACSRDKRDGRRIELRRCDAGRAAALDRCSLLDRFRSRVHG